MNSFFTSFIATAIATAAHRQTVTGWDALLTSRHGTNNYQLIGTYQG